VTQCSAARSRRNADDRRSEVTRIEQLPPAQQVEAEVVRYEPAELIFRVRSPSDGWLLVTDRWVRGWHAEINGRPAAGFGGNFIFSSRRGACRGPAKSGSGIARQHFLGCSSSAGARWRPSLCMQLGSRSDVGSGYGRVCHGEA
jgi:hypothetical protein